MIGLKNLIPLIPIIINGHNGSFCKCIKLALRMKHICRLIGVHHDLTGLANEEVVDGGCERCGTVLKYKQIRQWVLRITDYAEKLLDGLDKLDGQKK